MRWGLVVLDSFPAGHLFLVAIGLVLSLTRVSLSEGVYGRIAYCAELCGCVVRLSPCAYLLCGPILGASEALR
jgi:hypothetical protein